MLLPGGDPPNRCCETVAPSAGLALEAGTDDAGALLAAEYNLEGCCRPHKSDRGAQCDDVSFNDADISGRCLCDAVAIFSIFLCPNSSPVNPTPALFSSAVTEPKLVG